MSDEIGKTYVCFKVMLVIYQRHIILLLLRGGFSFKQLMVLYCGFVRPVIPYLIISTTSLRSTTLKFFLGHFLAAQYFTLATYENVKSGRANEEAFIVL